MAKTKKNEPVVINMEALSRAAKKLMDAEKKNDRSINILEAQIKDDFCHYKYEVISGKDIGFKHKVEGIGIISDDMRNAFNKLKVHLAVIDDVYKHSNIEITDIDTKHTDELALLYYVTGLKIKGGEEDEAVILIGNKVLSAGSRMELETPKVPIDSLSSYTWHNELKDAVDQCREEVALYHYGKYTPVQKDEEEEEDPKQAKIDFSKKENDTDTEQVDADFENAKV